MALARQQAVSLSGFLLVREHHSQCLNESSQCKEARPSLANQERDTVKVCSLPLESRDAPVSRLKKIVLSYPFQVGLGDLLELQVISRL